MAGIRTYTSKGLNPGYHFDYYSPIFPIDSIYNKRDHWGFYNGAPNDTSKHFPAVPYVFPNGANREPNDSAVAGTLKSITDPAGGVTYYDFECNDVYRPYELIPDYQVFNGMVHFSDTISLHHVYRNVDTFKLSYVSLRKLNNISPISVNAELICRITNFDSSVVFGTHTVNLYDLYQSGEQYLAFSNLPDGQVLFKASLSTGSAITARNMFMKLEWDKEVPNTADRIKSNGIRIRQIRHYDPVTGITDTIKTFRYVMNNGRSSGFLGVKPVYTHPYQVNFDNGSIYMTNSYTALNREPVNHFDFSEGSQVSYGRVEVIRGSIYNNLGKEVHEFTTLADFQDYVKPVSFPYVPQFQRDWLLALPKKVSIYNKDGRLIQTTTNEFNYRTSSYDNQYFRSLKLGKLSSTYSGYEIIPANLLSESFEGRFYYPETGRADIKKTTEVFYYEDQSTRQNVQEIFYDDQFNVTRLLSDYDKSRNLKIEKRIYYPYNYTLVGPVGRLRDSLIFASISSEDWIFGDGNPRLIGIQISEFQELPQGYIKPRSSYALRSNKPIPLSQIGEFNPAVLVRNSTLIKEASRNTIFDEKGNLVEVLNPQTGISNVVIMGYSGNLPVATVTQALKSDVAYSSFEASDHGGWELGSAVDFVYEGITGKRAYSLAEGEIVKSGLNSGKTYILTYWKHGSGTVSVS
ncbi:MAG TPA: hypothetical protein PK977_09140, partial [Chitinophagaceae bacterium]|nr:hypothetical protein [Chitinophagaceae bacterium]